MHKGNKNITPELLNLKTIASLLANKCKIPYYYIFRIPMIRS